MNSISTSVVWHAVKSYLHHGEVCIVHRLLHARRSNVAPTAENLVVDDVPGAGLKSVSRSQEST